SKRDRTPRYFALDQTTSYLDEYQSDFTLRERIGAAFGMARVNVGKARLIGGVRVERTDVNSDAFTMVTRGSRLVAEPVSGSGSLPARARRRLDHVPAKASLDFVRVLRAALCRELRGGDLTDYLDVGDARTMTRLFARVGLRGSKNLTALQYIDVQRVIRDVPLIDELEKVLAPMET